MAEQSNQKQCPRCKQFALAVDFEKKGQIKCSNCGYEEFFKQ